MIDRTRDDTGERCTRLSSGILDGPRRGADNSTMSLNEARQADIDEEYGGHDGTQSKTAIQQVKQSSRFPHSLVLEISSSEPRDALQSERTCLVFIRFASTLFFSGFGMMINFKFDSSGSEEHRRRDQNSMLKKIMVFAILVLSSAAFVLSGVNHLVTMKRYAQHRIATYSFSNLATIICMTCIAFVLVFINVFLIVLEYLDIS